MTLGFDVVKRILPQFEENVKYNVGLSDVYQNMAFEKRCIESMGQNLQGHYHEVVPFLIQYPFHVKRISCLCGLCMEMVGREFV